MKVVQCVGKLFFAKGKPFPHFHGGVFVGGSDGMAIQHDGGVMVGNQLNLWNPLSSALITVSDSTEPKNPISERIITLRPSSRSR